MNDETIKVNVEDYYSVATMIENEKTRQSNEAQRIVNENDRENYYETFKNDVAQGKFNGKDGINGQNGINGINGINGDNGATFTPSVSSSGELSWSNDKGLPNPATVNIKGQDGVNGKDGANGKDGIDGKDGTPGQDGVGFTNATAGPVTEQDGYTITPLTFYKSDGTNEVVNVKAKNGESADNEYKIYELKTDLDVTDSHSGLTLEQMNQLELIIQESIDNQTLPIIICQNAKAPTFIVLPDFSISELTEETKSFSFIGNFACNINTGGQVSSQAIVGISTVYLRLKYSSTGGIDINGTKITDYMAEMIPTYNMTSYTPTSDYNPATKKYADSVGASTVSTVRNAITGDPQFLQTTNKANLVSAINELKNRIDALEGTE